MVVPTWLYQGGGIPHVFSFMKHWNTTFYFQLTSSRMTFSAGRIFGFVQILITIPLSLSENEVNVKQVGTT